MDDQLPIVGIIGEKFQQFYTMSINGMDGVLRPRSFEYLAKLALGFLLYEDHWIHKLDIESGGNQAKYIYTLRQELKAQYGDIAEKLILNDCGCQYRLNVSGVRFDYPRLAEYPNVEIRDIEKRLKEVGQ